jgi:hypothetical protein
MLVADSCAVGDVDIAVATITLLTSGADLAAGRALSGATYMRCYRNSGLQATATARAIDRPHRLCFVFEDEFSQPGAANDSHHNPAVACALSLVRNWRAAAAQGARCLSHAGRERALHLADAIAAVAGAVLIRPDWEPVGSHLGSLPAMSSLELLRYPPLCETAMGMETRTQQQ